MLLFVNNISLLAVVIAVVVVRWAVSLNSYSGARTPPMYGDYEAQRHWMEITYNLPVKQWYVNSTENDLAYWGLDYPPLTAYHSWLCAALAARLNSSWVELKTSRGYESTEHKTFMRFTVLLADLLIYFPATFYYFLSPPRSSINRKKVWFSLIVTLLYPGLILVDHGHFQYNCVSLGLCLWGVVGICRQRHLLAAVAFVLALCYKQMALYHAMPFFVFLLAESFKSSENSVWKLVKLGVVVVLSFLCCWLPFIQQPLPVLQRLFPFARGVFEDKVANVWCSLSLIVKFKQIFSVAFMVKLCLGTTFLMLLPHSVHLLLRSTVNKFKVALVNSSLIFFLFSFQVHEKSILLVALPVCLLLPDRPFACCWFLLVSTFSMLPLLMKDGLIVPFVGTTMLFAVFARTGLFTASDRVSTGWRVLFATSMLGAVALTACSLTVAPPAGLPDLFAVLVSTYSCGHFVLFLLYFHWLQYTIDADAHSYRNRNQVTDMKHTAIKSRKLLKKTT